MFQNIIFDWSGVIKDAVKSNLWVVNQMFKKFGVQEISLSEFKKNWQQPYMLFYNRYLPNLTIEEEQKIYQATILRQDCPKSQAFPGITELIQKLKQKNIFLAVISSDFPATIYPEIKEYGLENIFNTMITGIHDKASAIKDLIQKNNLDLNQTVFIGDSNHEIEVGKQNGVKTIGVTWGFSAEKNLKLENPNFIVHDSKELEKILFSKL